jgi:MFS family permease
MMALACPVKRQMAAIVARLTVANALVELSGQYALLSGPHHDMLLQVLAAAGPRGRPSGGVGGELLELAVGRLMVQQSAVAAAAEFLLQPVSGRLSDHYGRRPLLVATAALAALARMLVVVRPCLATVWLAKIGDAFVRACDSTVCSALADLADGDETALAGTRGLVWSLQGAMAGGGPILAHLLTVAGGPRLAYLAAAGASAGVAVACLGLPETRRLKTKVAGSPNNPQLQPAAAAAAPHGWLVAMNPFGCLKMLLAAGPYSQGGWALRRLSAARALQSLTFYGLYDVADSFMRLQLQMSSGVIARFRAFEGGRSAP